jgi:serine/threonine protein kinase
MVPSAQVSHRTFVWHFCTTDCIKIFDFGLAKELPTMNNGSYNVFHMTAMCGSPRYVRKTDTTHLNGSTNAFLTILVCNVCCFCFCLFFTGFKQMAPEVGIGQPYNELCDVYSFGVLVWEMMALRKPYGTTDIAGMVQDVWRDCPGAKRPCPSLVKTGKYLKAQGLNRLWRRCHLDDRDTNAAGSPAALQSLVVSCWSNTLDERPSMSSVENQLWEELMRFDHGNVVLKARRHLSIGSTFFSDEDEDQRKD